MDTEIEPTQGVVEDLAPAAIETPQVTRVQPSTFRKVAQFLQSDFGTLLVLAAFVAVSASAFTVAAANRFGLLGSSGQTFVTVDLVSLVVPKKSTASALIAAKASPEVFAKIANSEAELSATVERALQDYSVSHHVVIIQKDAVFAGGGTARDITAEVDAAVAPQRARVMEMIAKAATQDISNATPVVPRQVAGDIPPFPAFPKAPSVQTQTSYSPRP